MKRKEDFATEVRWELIVKCPLSVLHRARQGIPGKYQIAQGGLSSMPLTRITRCISCCRGTSDGVLLQAGSNPTVTDARMYNCMTAYQLVLGCRPRVSSGAVQAFRKIMVQF